MGGKLLIVHGGAPTAVINASLYGAADEAIRSGKVDRVYGALGGMGGVLKKRFFDLKTLPAGELARLPDSPGSAIGTSRDAMEEADYDAVAAVFKEFDIRYALFNGGNGTMDTCGKVHAACVRAGVEVCVAGIPKTMDNDIAVTDHSPGFASAARYMAGTVREICADVRSLPIHVCVVEAMGRNAGWVTAAAALARQDGEIGPDLIYLPERDFSEDDFLADVEAQWARGKGVTVVVSEGIHGPGGAPLVEPVFQTGRSVYFGDVSAHLAQLVIKKLGIKARNEKPGIAGRCSVRWQSAVDREEAVRAGREAARAVLSGESGVMVGFRRLGGETYRSETFLVPIREVMLHEARLPDGYINGRGNGVTEDYARWCAPLLGEPLPEFITVQGGRP